MIYLMSDIHGHMKRYRNVLSKIELKEEDHLYVLGDCIDRNPDGLEILRELFYMPNATVLLGNHELMMLDALTKTHPDNVYFRLWYRNGGNITHQEYEQRSKAYQDEMIGIIRQLPVNIAVCCNGTHYLLVHGGPIGYKPKREDLVADSVWKRLELGDLMPSGRTVVFGHTTTRHYQFGRPYRIYHGPDKIGIDCGCAYEEGRLACLRLDDMKEFYSDPDYMPFPKEELEVLLNAKRK